MTQARTYAASRFRQPMRISAGLPRVFATLPIGEMAYGAASYAVGVAALVELILIMLGVLDFTGGPVHLGPLPAGLFNLGLLMAFALQHSVMARARFKERWTRIVHPSLERSTYLLATGVVLLPLLWLWQPMPAVLWSVGSPLARRAITGIGTVGRLLYRLWLRNLFHLRRADRRAVKMKLRWN